MKGIIQLLSIFLLIAACNPAEHELQQTWIEKYSIHDANTEAPSFHKGQRSILKIEEDHLGLKILQSDLFADKDPSIYKYTYSLQNDLLLLFDNGKRDTLQYAISGDSLSLRYADNFARTSVYVKLPEYHLAHQESALYEFLTASSFQMLDSIRVQFFDDGRLIIPNFNFALGDHQLWILDKFEEELFLVIDGFSGFRLHVNEIRAEHFNGTIYGIRNKEIIFNKLPDQTLFEIDLLAGEWIEFQDEKKSLPPPPPVFNEEASDFYSREQLYFNDSILVKKHYFGIDTLRWETNREQDLILLPELDLPVSVMKWKIISLTDHKLVVERIPGADDMDENQVEQTTFVRNAKQ
jgi:hypothetical protein